jgi:hypothetical protein
LMEEGMALGCQQYVNNTYWMRGWGPCGAGVTTAIGEAAAAAIRLLMRLVKMPVRCHGSSNFISQCTYIVHNAFMKKHKNLRYYKLY